MRERCVCGAEWEISAEYAVSVDRNGGDWEADRQAWRDTHRCTAPREVRSATSAFASSGIPPCALCGNTGMHACPIAIDSEDTPINRDAVNEYVINDPAVRPCPFCHSRPCFCVMPEESETISFTCTNRTAHIQCLCPACQPTCAICGTVGPHTCAVSHDESWWGSTA